MAGVSVGTLYNYVEGKEALLLLCAERPFVDICAGRELPIAGPVRAELVSRLEATLTEHVRVPELERALGVPFRSDQLSAQLDGIVGELFALIASTRVGADVMEKSAREAPDLATLFYLHVRRTTARSARRVFRNGRRCGVPPIPGNSRVCRPLRPGDGDLVGPSPPSGSRSPKAG